MAKITDEWAAYCFDNAVHTFGNWVEGKLNETDKQGNPRYRIEHLIGDKQLTLEDSLLQLGAIGSGAVKTTYVKAKT